ncbi:MAG: ABC-2 family transporter protein [bacterium]|nr:ABC-2 family transporter protein [bacterium]
MWNKYLVLVHIAWQNGLAYPLSFGLWRLRQIITMVMPLTLWTVIYAQQDQAFGYDRSEMISYIFLSSLLQSAVLSTSLHRLAKDIYTGTISQLFIKPINIFYYFAANEVADKAKNVLFSLIEAVLLFAIFKPELVMPTLDVIGLFLLWVLGGILIHFFIEILFGCIGFWSPDSWGPKFFFFVTVEATAGKLFPLDVLPQAAQNIIYLTPFPYLSYAQTQLFLGRLNGPQLQQISLSMIFWIVIIASITLYIWNRSLKTYSAAGG